MPKQKCIPHSWMCLAKSSNTEVSGPCFVILLSLSRLYLGPAPKDSRSGRLWTKSAGIGFHWVLWSPHPCLLPLRRAHVIGLVAVPLTVVSRDLMNDLLIELAYVYMIHGSLSSK